MFSFSPRRSVGFFLFLLLPVTFQTAIKRQNENYAATPLWLADNNPLLLLCASFYFKDIKI